MRRYGPLLEVFPQTQPSVRPCCFIPDGTYNMFCYIGTVMVEPADSDTQRPHQTLVTLIAQSCPKLTGCADHLHAQHAPLPIVACFIPIGMPGMQEGCDPAR